MGQQRSVNVKQFEVLNWIVEGCPDGVMSGHEYKTSAVALQSRGLIDISKRGGGWKAVATDAGRHYAKHGEYPAQTKPVAPATQAAARPAPSGARREPQPASEPPISSVRQLIVNLQEHGGTLTVQRGTGGTYEGLIKAAHRLDLVPAGKRLTIEGGGYSSPTQVIRLVDKPAWMTAVLDPVPVAERLVKPHPAVVTLKSDRQHRLRFKPETRNRALRILDALAKEARARGYTVTTPDPDRYTRSKGDDLTIIINGHSHGLRVTEQADKSPHTPTARELANAASPLGSQPPKYDHHPSGRLTITVEGYGIVRQGNFGDTKTLNLADRLPAILQEIELRAAADEERRLQRERAQAERQRQWERVRDEAVTALGAAHRANVLADQHAQWRKARELDDYLQAMSDHIATLTGERRAEAQASHAWATEYAAHLDPFTRPLRTPEPPEPTAEAIKPFMGGLSPYGPLGR